MRSDASMRWKPAASARINSSSYASIVRESEAQMHSRVLTISSWSVLVLAASCAWAQQPNACASLMNFKAAGVEITKAASVPAGTTVPNQWGPGHSAPLPAHCRVEGVIDRRTGVGREEFGSNFALAMPDPWNGDFLMQGGG